MITTEEQAQLMRESTMLAELLDAGISVRGVRNLIDEFGGGSIYVPTFVPRGHPLDNILSGHDIGRLCALYGQDHMYVPKGRKYQTALLHHRVFNAWQGGGSISQLQKKFGLSDRHIRRILKKRGVDIIVTPRAKPIKQKKSEMNQLELF